MTAHRNGKPDTLVYPQQITARDLFIAAYISGSAANPSKLHDLERETSCAIRCADMAMEKKGWER